MVVALYHTKMSQRVSSINATDTANQQKKLKVTGVGKVVVKPDYVFYEFTFEYSRLNLPDLTKKDRTQEQLDQIAVIHRNNLQKRVEKINSHRDLTTSVRTSSDYDGKIRESITTREAKLSFEILVTDASELRMPAKARIAQRYVISDTLINSVKNKMIQTAIRDGVYKIELALGEIGKKKYEVVEMNIGHNRVVVQSTYMMLAKADMSTRESSGEEDLSITVTMTATY